jgi:hypothetical protein
MKTTKIDIPFTLTCSDCDAGMNIDSEEQALAEGWTCINYARNLPMANYVGLCPDCQEKYGNWLSAEACEE